MKMIRLNIQLPQSIKAKLDALRAEGTTASGLIRRLLNEFFAGNPKNQKGGHQSDAQEATRGRSTAGACWCLDMME